MKRLGWRGWSAVGLIVAGATLLVTSILFGTGWNIATAVAITFSGTLTLVNLRFVRRKQLERERADADAAGASRD